MTTQNPLWPLIDEAVCWAAGPGQSSVQPLWCSMIERTEGTNQIDRGKDYELDQTQPGKMTTRWRNDDGAFDGDNPASPYAGYIDPYRLIRRRAQYPATANLLTQNQATAGQATVIASAPWLEQPWPVGATPDANSVYQNAFAPTTIAASASAFTGNQVFSSAWPAAGGYGTFVLGMRNWSVAPGAQYAPSVQVRSATASITPTVQLQLAWYTAAGALISVASGTATAIAAGSSAAWTPVSVTAVAPSNAAGALVQLIAVSGPATAWTVHTSGWDVRKGAVAGYSTPGTWYPKFTGYIERWPQSWTSGGNYGVVDLTAVDLFANFANHEMLAPFKADLMALGPNFLYPLDEANGTIVFADLTGKRGNATITQAAVLNTVLPGSSVASGGNAPQGADFGVALTGAFLGGPGPVLQSQQPAGTNPVIPNNGATVRIPPDPSTGLVGVPQTTAFTRLIAVRATGLGAGAITAFALYDTDPATGLHNNTCYINLTSNNMQLAATVSNASGAYANFLPNLGLLGSTAGSGTLTDTDWHLVGLALSADGKTVTMYADGGAPVATSLGVSVRPAAGTMLTMGDAIGSISYPGVVGQQWVGNLAFMAEIPAVLTAGQWQSLWNSWRNAWANSATTAESSDSRYKRILAWLNYTGPTRISKGLSVAYGPATDVAAQFGLQCLQNVVDTEAGQHFIGADGAVVFQSRRDRYNPTPILTFGENTAGGEIPYLNVATDRDPTRVGNDAQVTSQYGNALYRNQDGPASDPTTSQGKYGTITISRTVNSVDQNELTAASQFLLYANKDPLTRLQAIKIDVAALAKTNPGIWASMLALELGSCVLVNRRPSNAPTITLTCFIEKISWTVDDQNRAYCTLQLSNAAKRSGFWKWDTSRYAPDAGSMTPQSALNGVQTTMTIVTAAGSPPMTNNAGAYPLDIIIDAEQITLTAAPGSTSSPQTFTIVRGVNGTAPAAHTSLTTIALAAQAKWAY